MAALAKGEQLSPRRPWRSSGPEVIGWKDWGRHLPAIGGIMCTQPLALPYYFPRLLGGRGRSWSLAPKPERTEWISSVERALGDEGIGMTEVWRYHSERTWQFAAALAAEKASGPDDELIYVAALMHDSGMFLKPNEGESFAAAGARLARDIAHAAGVDQTRANLVATAIDSHISMNPGNVLGEYIRFGSLLDLTATGVWKLDRGLVDRVYHRTRRGFPSDLRTRWLAECNRLPLGRAAYAKSPGALLLATRFAPLPHRKT